MSALPLLPLLIEIGTEELPPLEMLKLRDALSQQLQAAFLAEHLSFGLVKTFVSPRRLAVIFENVPTMQADKPLEKKGPPIQAAFDAEKKPTPALMGFARSLGVTIDELTCVETDKGSFFVYQRLEKGRPIAELIPTLLASVLTRLPANKTMRWGNKKEHFVRPVHWLLVLHGEAVLPFQAFGLNSSNLTFGHRIHSQGPIQLKHASEYEQVLLDHGVIAEVNKRQEKIHSQILEIAQNINKMKDIEDIDDAQVLIAPDLLAEVCGLTEWPKAYLAQFSPSFLSLPKEVLICAMQKHQRCFAVMQTKTACLLPYFILISNLEPTQPKQIIHGNERVMHARLSDAQFFYEQDQRLSLESRLPLLNKMIFQKNLGTLYDKSERLARLASYIGTKLGVDPKACERAGWLCKTDLLTSMVGEFPELQGIMGRYYALAAEESVDVAKAIEDHYYPKFAKDRLPESKISLALALADRLDTLVGSFGMGIMPSSDKDPYGLRRAALGVIRLLIEPKLNMDLPDLMRFTIRNYEIVLSEKTELTLLPFILERLRAYALEQGFSTHLFDAVLASAPKQPFDFYLRLQALAAFSQLPEAASLSQAFKRVNNLLIKSTILTLPKENVSIDPMHLTAPAEVQLYEKMLYLMPITAPLMANQQYEAALKHLASLQPEVDAFFDTVMVNVEDPILRQNRLALLLHLRQLFVNIADIALM